MNLATYTASNDTLQPKISLDVLVEAYNEVFCPPIIEVWVGSRKSPCLPLPECPKIIRSELIDPNTLYIMAGVGIVSGVNVDDRLWEEGYLAIWTDTPPPSPL